MEECRHCGETFEEETPYLQHLRDEHGDDLGAIEERRVQELDDGEGVPDTVLYAAVGVGALLIALVAYAFVSGGGGGDGSGSVGDLPESGDQSVIQNVETIESSGNQHVGRDQQLNYDEMPPTGGPHYAGTVDAGFYSETPPLGDVVHSLEHGAIVIYYEESALSDEAEQNLREYANTYTGTWSSVVVAPNPSEDPEAPYVLTAWEKKLTMDEYDAAVVRAFVAEFLGRGPENPVR